MFDILKPVIASEGNVPGEAVRSLSVDKKKRRNIDIEAHGRLASTIRQPPEVERSVATMTHRQQMLAS